MRALVRSAVLDRAVELEEVRQQNLAIRIANAINGAKQPAAGG